MKQPPQYSEAAASQLYNQAISKWGEVPQLMMAMEESAELIQAVSKLLRNKAGAENHLAEEMADVTIMLEQVILILERRGISDIRSQIAKERENKLQRLAERLSQ